MKGVRRLIRNHPPSTSSSLFISANLPMLRWSPSEDLRSNQNDLRRSGRRKRKSCVDVDLDQSVDDILNFAHHTT